jgi:membrane-associated phospholipid phosphatase
MEKFLDTLASAISFLFFPLFMPLYGISLLFQLPLFSFFPKSYIVVCFLIIIVFSILLPLISYILLKQMNMISNVKMYNKEDRVLPMLVTSFSFFACAIMLFRYAMPLFIINIMVSIAIATLITAIISKWWKISAHLTGIGGLVASIFIVSLSTGTNPVFVFCASILAAGLLAAARLQLRRHTPLQLIAGFANGILCISLFSLFDWGILIRKATALIF